MECLKTRSKNKLEHNVEALILHWLVKQSRFPCNENHKRIIGRVLNITRVWLDNINNNNTNVFFLKPLALPPFMWSKCDKVSVEYL
jgi:hypothetical protein